MNRAQTGRFIADHEGVRETMYLDTRGIKTVGVGFNLEREGARADIEAQGLDFDKVCSGDQPLEQHQMKTLFEVDFDHACELAPLLVENFNNLPDDVQMVIVDMIFNLGHAGFAKFKKTIAAFNALDYCTAATEMRNSLWARQVPNRADEDIKIVESYCR